MIGYVLFGIAAVAVVILGVLRGQEGARARAALAQLEAAGKDLAAAQAEGKERKETLEARTAELADAKEKLRDAKKRLHDEKGTRRKEDIDHARAEVERAAQSQVEAARHEAHEAQLEVKRLKAELEALKGKGRERPRTGEVPAAIARPAPAALAEPHPPRELTEVEQNRIAVLEKAAVKQSDRVKHLEEEVKKQTRRAETNNHVYIVAKSELDLAKAKMSAIERRMNKALLELDKLRQAAFKAGLVNEMVAAAAAAEAEAEKETAVAAPPPADASTPPATPVGAPEAKVEA